MRGGESMKLVERRVDSPHRDLKHAAKDGGKGEQRASSAIYGG